MASLNRAGRRAALILTSLFCACGAGRAAEPVVVDFTVTTTLDAPVGEVWAAATGDVSPWWDHRFGGDPSAPLVIEPRAGGRFYEDLPNGSVTHADVINVLENERIVLSGPLGLVGEPIAMSYDLRFAPTGEGATAVSVRVAGFVANPDFPPIIEGVWRHFLIERLKVYVEAGCHRRRGETCAALAG